MRAFWTWLTAATMIGGGTVAQEVGNNTAIGDWIVTCEAVSTGQNLCRIVQRQTRTETGALVLQLIGYPTDDGGAVLAAQVPIGAYLPTQLVFRDADNAEAPEQTMIWQRCSPEICEAALQIDAQTLQAMNDAGALLFGYQPAPGGEPVITQVNTATLVEALNAVRPDPK